ncbi:hypothetical protein IV203_036533 [Nitzschia inconspicua]|uniref:Uncharacterized protein n=1 Tax=Nitzschia inconspicua TaxID=303405 RepID=A0A9K3LG58_9STRA|nr:hypothetical protein IV203_036533 [Nitzschia inconspicua]
MSFASTTFEKPEVAVAEEERQRLGRTETRWVRVLRILTLLILVLTAGFVVMAVYSFGRKSQQMSFSSEFEAHAIRVIESFHTGIGRQLSACDTLSASITSYAIESGSVFPNVTVPHWGVMSNNFQIQAQATFVQFYPLVTGNETDDWNRTLWQKYAALNHNWLMPSFTKEHLMRTAQDLQFGYEATPLTSEGVEGTEDSYENDLGHLAHAGSFSPYIWSSRENGPSLPLSGP